MASRSESVTQRVKADLKDKKEIKETRDCALGDQSDKYDVCTFNHPNGQKKKGGVAKAEYKRSKAEVINDDIAETNRKILALKREKDPLERRGKFKTDLGVDKQKRYDEIQKELEVYEEMLETMEADIVQAIRMPSALEILESVSLFLYVCDCLLSMCAPSFSTKRQSA